MSYDESRLDDYVDVATRIADFRAKHPGGYLAPVNPEQPYRIEEVTGTDRDGNPVTQTFIVYTALADDGTGRRGIGCAWEIFPGRTPYTRGSELMNAETSAWGRAIIALGASDSKQGIASREEVRNRAAEQTEADATRGTDWRPPANPRTRKATRERDTAGETTAWNETAAPEDLPGSSLPAQHQAMGILFARAGLTAHDARMAAIARMIPDLDEIPESSKVLSYNDAAMVMRELQSIAAAEKKEAG